MMGKLPPFRRVYKTPGVEKQVEDAMDVDSIADVPGNPFAVIQVTSAGKDGEDCAKILINDVAVVMEKNENDHYRGLHMAVINP